MRLHPSIRIVLGKLQGLLDKWGFIAEVVLICASGYLLLKKLTDFTLSGFVRRWLSEEAMAYYPQKLALVVAAAILVRIAALALSKFHFLSYAAVEPNQISECLAAQNLQLALLKQRLMTTGKLSGPETDDRNMRRQAAANVIESLAEHIEKAVPSVLDARKDLFISLYAWNPVSSVLEYEMHYYSARDLIESERIEPSNDRFANYECVKCISTPAQQTAYVLKRNDYAPGRASRSETVRHYMGCKISNDRELLAFLNIEFHNNIVFNTEKEMESFMEVHVWPFRSLLQFQYVLGGIVTDI